MIPTKVRMGLECVAQTSKWRSVEHCDKCPYKNGEDCHARVAKDALKYMAQVESIQRLAPIDDDRRRVGYLYTVYDKVAKRYICKDLPARKCAVLLGYASIQGFKHLCKRIEDGDDAEFRITRRKGNITNGPTKEEPIRRVMEYTVKTLDGKVLLERASSEEAAKVLGRSVAWLYRRMGRHKGNEKDSMVYCSKIVERVPRGGVGK